MRLVAECKGIYRLTVGISGLKFRHAEARTYEKASTKLGRLGCLSSASAEWICPETAQWLAEKFRYTEAGRILSKVSTMRVSLA